MKSISESLEDNAPHYRALTNCEVCHESMSVQYDSPRKICHECERYNIAFNEGIKAAIEVLKPEARMNSIMALLNLKRRTE